MRRLLLSLVLFFVALPAAAQSQFDFSFVVSRGPSETMSGTGRFTADAGTPGLGGTTIYTLTGATGTIVPSFLSDPETYTITDIVDFFGLADNVLTVTNGAVSFSQIGLFFEGGPAVLLFDRPAAAAYGFESRYDLDSFAIAQVQAAPGAVPEPATWAMLMLGFGVAGAALRRRPAPRVALA